MRRMIEINNVTSVLEMSDDVSKKRRKIWINIDMIESLSQNGRYEDETLIVLSNGNHVITNSYSPESLARAINMESMNEQDKKIGHRRVYTTETLKRDISKAGFKIKKTGGVFLKPLSNQQIEQDWNEKMIDAFYELGKEYPEISAEIYVVCVLEN